MWKDDKKEPINNWKNAKDIRIIRIRPIVFIEKVLIKNMHIFRSILKT